jgi:cellulose synthase/poly-beta-1,6-N-acetylglucosamine synthase-like glycosyltransferase
MTAFLLLWLGAQAVSVVAVLGFLVGLGRRVPLSREPAVAVIVAVKGRDIQFDPFIESLFAQDYANYRVIFAVESEHDPAVPAIEQWRQRHGDRLTLVVAGLAADEGQKTANLRAAVSHLTPQDEVLVFADADIVADRSWIRNLVAPLVAGDTDIVSGFTWVVVGDGRLSSFLLASMAASLSTFPRLPFLNAAWGGSTALFRRTFEKLDIARAWRGTLSDDLQLTAIAQRAGCRIAAPREVLPRTIAHTGGFAAVAAQARRWYMLVRVYVPVTYLLMLAGMTFLAAGWLVDIAGAAAADPLALTVLAAAFGCAVLRDFGRGLIVSRIWGRAGVAENLAFLIANPLITPFAAIANAGFAWSALLMRRTTWAGITYELRAPQQVKVLSRRPAS